MFGYIPGVSERLAESKVAWFFWGGITIIALLYYFYLNKRK